MKCILCDNEAHFCESCLDMMMGDALEHARQQEAHRKHERTKEILEDVEKIGK